MNLRLKWVTIFAGVVVLMAVVLTSSPKMSASTVSSHPYTGYAAPSFSLPDIQTGEPISLAKYQGKPLFINFFASWCPPCNAEAPDIAKAYQQYGDKVTFIGINLTNQDTVAKAETFMKKYGIQYPVLVDKNGQTGSLYKVLAIPTSLFVNKDGLIVARYSGAIPNALLIADLERISRP